MTAADEAERRGDAAAALAIMESHWLDEDGRLFWRPERVRRLRQIVALGPQLPRWAMSRWVLAQAAQALDLSMKGAHVRAIDLAIERRGTSDEVRARQESWHPMEVGVQVVDHDWIHRQLVLYDFGCLARFLRRGATPDLLAGAEPLWEWARAPMGGYRLVEGWGPELAWEDVLTGERFCTPTIGSAVVLGAGDHVIGRRVPVAGGAFFESVPLQVPDVAAQQVADDPAGWLDILSEWTSPDVPEAERVITGGFTFDLLTDVPPVLVSRAIQATNELRGSRAAGGVADVVLAAVEGDQTPYADGAPAPALVASLLVEPRVLDVLAGQLSPLQVDRLVRYAERELPPPWSGLCQRMATALRDAS